MNIEVITSFNQSYYERIGQKAVESWLKYWPETLTLTCYTEEFDIPGHPRLKSVDFKNLDQDYYRFQDDPDIKSRAKTFAKKAWCFMHAADTSAADRVVWLDADVITQQSVDLAFLQSILPDWALSTHLGVTYWEDKRGRPGPWLVPETGFFAVNTRHTKFSAFVAEYRRRYLEKDYQDLRRFYDNDVYGAALMHANTDVLDLCAGLKKPYKTPLRHTVLSPYLYHYKAQHRKEEFQSNCQ